MTLWSSYSYADQAGVEFIRLVEGHGSRVADTRGRLFFDCRTSASAMLLGQCGDAAPDAAAAIADQLGVLEYATLFRGSNRPAQELASSLARLFGPAFGRVFLSSTASEALETALKMARQYHKLMGEAGREVILSVRGGHHGQLLGGLAASTSAQALRSGGPRPEAFMALDLPEGSEVEALGQAIEGIGRGRIAALVVQPVMPWAGCRSLEAPALSAMAEVVRAAGGLFILDEGLSAFGRVAFPGVCVSLRVAPDLVSLGAACSNGSMPVAATLAGERVFGRFTAGEPEPCFEHGCTNSGHPVSCAAANAALPLIELANRRPDLPERRAALERVFRETADRHGLRHRGSGFLQGLSPGDGAGSGWAGFVRAKLQASGILVSELEGTVVLCPPIVCTYEDIAVLREALDLACAAYRLHVEKEFET